MGWIWQVCLSRGWGWGFLPGAVSEQGWATSRYPLEVKASDLGRSPPRRGTAQLHKNRMTLDLTQSAALMCRATDARWRFDLMEVWRGSPPRNRRSDRR